MALFDDRRLLYAGPATDLSPTPASLSSTPPTTVADSDSQHSDTSKLDVITVSPDHAIYLAAVDVESQETTPSRSPPSRRPRRKRASEPVYNISRLIGTADDGKRRARADSLSRRAISGDTLVGSIEVAGDATSFSKRPRDKALAAAGTDALHLQWSPHTPRTRRRAQLSPRPPQRISSRLAGVSSIAATLTSMSRKGRQTVDKGVTKLSRELRRLQDTDEFAGVDDGPVVHTVWSNGKYVDPNAPPPPATTNKSAANKEAGPKEEAKEPRPEGDDDGEGAGVDDGKEPVINTRQRRVKKYLDKGLYAGQDMPPDVFKGLSPAEKKKLATLPELKELSKMSRVNRVMPMPIYAGLRTLVAGRDFKLPFHVCHPMPPGQPKPDEWKKMTKNRFIGDSKDYWRKAPHLHDLSKCVCKPEDGCGDNCQNRIMLYECDASNCNVGKELCTNRAFADLAGRRAKGGKYRVGVEVIKTSDRGHGVRSNRCFEPNQIIMEYTGEIITEEECERRMNEEYKNNECYYLMSFDQHMIIDATTGSIARFVNHSCRPNCRMIKWIVSGQPRMALFAGDQPILTGDELTYDYNFDPFSAKNVQKCLCGEVNCRGVLGPKPRDVKPAKAGAVDLNKTIKATVKAGKRKLKELPGADEQDDGAAKKNNKKRKIAPAAGPERSLSSASLKAAKGAASALKRTVSSIGSKGKKTAAAQRRPVGKGGAVQKNSGGSSSSITTTARAIAAMNKNGKAKTKTKLKTKAKSKPTKLVKKKKKKKKGAPGDAMAETSSRASSMTIVAVTDHDDDAAASFPFSGHLKDEKMGFASPPASQCIVSGHGSGGVSSSRRPSLGSRRGTPRGTPRRVIKPSPKVKANEAIRMVLQEQGGLREGERSGYREVLDLS